MSKFIAANRHINPLTKKEQIAAKILGSNKVIGFQDAIRVWNVEQPGYEPTMPFSEDVLRLCAKENKKGADWRLVWINGFSLRQQHGIAGCNIKKQPCFDPNYTRWLEAAQNSWATQSVEVGYRLLNFKKNFSDMTWHDQNDEIAKLGEKFERAEEQVVAEACLTIFMVKKERLLKNWYHRGRFQASDGDSVDVGFFVQGGFRISYYWDHGAYSILGVVLSWKSA